MLIQYFAYITVYELKSSKMYFYVTIIRVFLCFYGFKIYFVSAGLITKCESLQSNPGAIKKSMEMITSTFFLTYL